MSMVDAIRHELDGRFRDLPVGKTYFSVRHESGPRIVRVGVCISDYGWDTREAAIDRMVSFINDHVDDYAVEFDVVPIEAVVDATYAEA